MLQDLFARTHGGMSYDLNCMHALLQALGSPHQRLQVVLVAGTNGKGSTSHLLATTLQHAGLCTGLFTSPHLLHFAERIRVNGEPMPEASLQAGYERLLAVQKDLPRPFSFFEATVALACLHFVACGVQVAVFEAGLGGRLDATNVFAPAARLACLLTRVDLDHQAVLGATPALIAVEKAGLWRPGRPAVVGPQRTDVAQALRGYAEVHKVPAQFLPAQEPQELAALLHTGRHWPAFLRQNAHVAWAACTVLAGQGLPVTPNHFAAAAHQFHWPGRYQRMVSADAQAPQLLLDGGHNPAGCAALAQALADDPNLRGKKLHGLVGALADKNLTAMLAPLRSQLASLALTATTGARGRSMAQLQQDFAPLPVYASVAAGMQALLQRLGGEDVLVVTGSLMLVGEALAQAGERHYFDAKLHGTEAFNRPI